jgi:hypothetical protein
MSPEERQHPQVQADEAQARDVLNGNGQNLENQPGPQSEALHKEFAAPHTQTSPKSQDAQPTHDTPIEEHSRGRTNDSGYKNDRSATDSIVASNQKLAADAPQRRSAPSSHVRMNFHDSHSETMRQAMLLADHAHDAEGMRPVKMTTTTGVGKDGRPTSGVYRPAHFPYDAEIGVSRDSAHPIITALHEFGHHLRHHLNENDFNSVINAIQQTPEVNLIKEMNYDPSYWLHENELFARAYAQWVIERVNHPEARAAKEELQNILGSIHGFEQFSGLAWQKVKTRINIAMQPKEKP